MGLWFMLFPVPGSLSSSPFPGEFLVILQHPPHPKAALPDTHTANLLSLCRYTDPYGTRGLLFIGLLTVGNLYLFGDHLIKALS